MKAGGSREELCRKLGYKFAQPQLLQRALTHRSFSPENNERLEFLGDSILGSVISRHLYNTYPDLSEGELSRMRSNLVREEALASFATKLELGSCLNLGEGERKSGGSRRSSMLADAMEAIFGAVLLDGGYAEAEKVILKLFVPYLEKADLSTLGKDSKTLLQEHLQGKRIPLPIYQVVATQGVAHAQLFAVECSIPSLQIVTRGEGTSRRNAEQQAAQEACKRLNISS